MQIPLRIIQAVHGFPPLRGGLETHAYEMSVQMARAGAPVAVHTVSCDGSQQADAALSPLGVQVKRHFSIKFPFFSSLVWIPLLPVFLMGEKGGVVCSHGFGSITPFCAAIGAKLSGKKFVWTIHGLPKFSGLGRFLVGFYRLLPMPVIGACSDKIICVSQPLAEEMKGVLGENASRKIVVIPNGVGEEFLSEGQNEGQRHSDATKSFVILFVGRLDRSKGVFVLLSAFEKFHARHPDSVLKFVGPDEGQKEKLSAMAKEKSLPVQFETAAKGQMPLVYSSASVCVLPSEYEGFGLSVLESWACGTPAVSTHVGIAPQFLSEAFGEESAGLFMFHDEDGLLSCLERIYLSKPDLKKRWAADAKKALAHYTWKEAARKTLDAIQN